MAPTRKAAQKAKQVIEQQDRDEDEDAEGEESMMRLDEEEQDDRGEGGSGSVRSETVNTEDEESDFETARPTKKARTTAPATNKKGKGKATTTKKKVNNRRTNRLQFFRNMPFDIMNEICSHLDPQTLLNMARTSKSFYDVLSSKSSKCVWIVSQNNALLPELEDDSSSGMGLARLVYERNCYVCGKNRAMKVDYCVRARYCQYDQKQNLVNERNLRKLFATKNINLHHLAIQCSLYTDISTTNRRTMNNFYFFPEVQVHSARLYELEEEQKMIDAENEKNAKGKGKGKAKEEDGFDESETEEKGDVVATYVARRKQIKEAAFNDGKNLLKWESSSATARKADQGALKAKRKADVFAKLTELGHDERDFPYYGEFLEQTGALTPAVWNRISNRVLGMVDRNNRSRLLSEANARKRDRQLLLRPFYDGFKAKYFGSGLEAIFPTFEEVIRWKVLAFAYEGEDSFIDQAKWDAAEDDVLKELVDFRCKARLGIFKRLIDAFKGAGRPVTWGLARKIIDFDKDKDRRSYMGEKYGEDWDTFGDDDEFKLDLNSMTTLESPTLTSEEMDTHFESIFATFQCSKCSTYERYPAIYDHFATSHPGDNYIYPRPPTSNRIAATASLIESLGMDESTVSEQDFVALGDVLECFKCSEKEKQLANVGRYNLGYWHRGGQPIPMKTDKFGWAEALEHLDQKHGNEYSSYYAITHSSPKPKLRVMPVVQEETSEADPVAGPSNSTPSSANAAAGTGTIPVSVE